MLAQVSPESEGSDIEIHASLSPESEEDDSGKHTLYSSPENDFCMHAPFS